LGPRTQAAAYAVVHAVRQHLAPDCLPVFSSDGLAAYFYALTAHFGAWAREGRWRRPRWRVAAGLVYGQVRKVYRRHRLVRVTPRMLLGTCEHLRTRLRRLGLSGTLNTAFVERLNLTVRRRVAGLARRTWSTAQRAPCLLAHLEWWRAYYHFVRPHEALRIALAVPRARGGKRQPQRYRRRTPAMAAGLTTRRWTVGDLLALPVVPPVLAVVG
jgi:hypothetical protein